VRIVDSGNPRDCRIFTPGGEDISNCVRGYEIKHFVGELPTLTLHVVAAGDFRARLTDLVMFEPVRVRTAGEPPRKQEVLHAKRDRQLNVNITTAQALRELLRGLRRLD
jgi:hypothetical protein